MADIQALTKLITDAQELAEQKEAEKLASRQQKSTAVQSKKLEHKVEETFGINFKVPDYDIIYKQQVEASEVYGGFQQMTPSSMDSQFIIVRIKLPGEVSKNVDVELTEQTLTLFGKYHRMHLELPHPIIEEQSHAKWKQQGLEITMRRKDVE